jgi:nucleotide-binding universal stress UspA family protein
MKKILCATRGGEASRKTQDAVIAMAKREGATILFLYVVDLEFLKVSTHGARPDVVTSEMEQMGEFLLTLACERAAAQRARAEMFLRHGPLIDALELAARENGVDAIALGQPSGAGSFFSLTGLRKLATKIEKDLSIETYIV